jgi:superfamily II DNA or RNA helicase
MIALRPYQVDCVDAIEEAFAAHTATLAVMATGLGKTICFADLIGRRAKHGRAMVLAHREELIDQAAEKIAWVTGLPVDIEMADRRASNLIKSPVVVSSIQTQIAGRNGKRRMHGFDPHEFATIIFDEAHHCTSDSYVAVASHYLQNPNARLLGVTATPKRTDQLALGQMFESCAFRMGIRDAIQEGWLVPLKVRHVKVESLDLSAVETVAGDFNQHDLGVVMALPDVVKGVGMATLEHAGDRKALIFCASVEQAAAVTLLLNAAKPNSANLVTGKTPRDERRTMIDDYRKSRFQFLCNYSVLLEGFDVWDTSCIVVARPTKSALLLEQMIGRGTRPDAEEIEGIDAAHLRRDAIRQSAKPDGLIVDFVGRVGKHEPARVIDVLGGKMKDAVRELAEEHMNQGCEDVDEAIAWADAALRFAKPVIRGKVKAIVEAFDLFDLDHRVGAAAIESWQKEKLERWRMPIPESAEEAQDLIDEVRRRTRMGLATYRMAKQLKRRGCDPNMPFEQAKAIMQEWFGQ